MAYEIQALIALRETVESLADRYPAAHLVNLLQGFALIPLTAELTGEMGEAFQVPLLFEEELPKTLDEACQRASTGGGAIAYVECESEAGPFWQASVVWRDRKIVLGPLVDPGLDDNGPPTQDRHEQPQWPINRALRELGVKASYELPSSKDEFEAVGLSRYRLTRNWVGQD